MSNYSSFAVLQSNVHLPWAALHSSGLEERLGYRPTDCFETFPFPKVDPRTVIPSVEEVGIRLYKERANYLVDTTQGLTQTYNHLKDPKCDEPRIVALRKLHEDMDRAVLDAYGWTDLTVPPFCPKSPDELHSLEEFQDTVIDRLFVLNAERAAEEKRVGAARPTKGRKPRPGKGVTERKDDSNDAQSELSFDLSAGESS